MKHGRSYQFSEVVPVYDTEQHYCIAIVYLAIGKYDIFWDEFYCSCEQYLLQDISEGKACMSYPFDGRFYFCTVEESAFYRRDCSIDYLFRYKNSRYRDDEAENESRKEFLKVCGMTSKELRRYIRCWIDRKV